MEFISERVSVQESDDRLSVVIDQRLFGWKRSAFILWGVLWLLCGVFFVYAVINMATGDQRIPLFIMLAFWAYYAWKIGKALLYRLNGFEKWRVKDGELTLMDSTFGGGVPKDFFKDNISELGVIDIDEGSWKWQFSNSLWQIGGERIGFSYMGRKVVFGKGLSAKEAKRLVTVLGKYLR